MAGPKRPEFIFPTSFLYKVLRSGKTKSATTRSTRRIPGWSPACEKKTCRSSCRAGRIRRSAICFAAPRHQRPRSRNVHTVRTGIEYMAWAGRVVHQDGENPAQPRGLDRLLPDWAGGHRGRFPDLRGCRCCTRISAAPACRSGATFARSADSTTSYGSYLRRGAERKDHLGQAGARKTPKFIIESVRDDRGAAGLRPGCSGNNGEVHAEPRRRRRKPRLFLHFLSALNSASSRLCVNRIGID